MVVYLINTSQKTETLHFPIGLGNLAKSLLLNGYEFKIVDLIPIPYEMRQKEFKNFVSSVSKPGIFGFSIIAGNNHIIEVEKLAALVKQADRNHTIVYGGPLPSSVPELCLKNTLADYIIVGEGEEALITFLRSFEKKSFGSVNNLIYIDEKGVVRANRKIRVQDLDMYNPIPYNYFKMDFYTNYLKETNRCFEISGSRGCRGACTFCFRFSGPGLTYRSAENLLHEVKFVYENYGINKFNFTDENFLEQKDNFYQFLELLAKENIDIKFRGQTRVDEITDDFCELLVRQGLMSIDFGVESASNDILKRIAKGINIEDIERKIKLMRSYGVDVYVGFIIGFPWETKDTIMALKDFIVRNSLEGYCNINYMCPLPSTKIYEDARKRGLIGDEWKYVLNLGNLYKDLSVNMTSFPHEEIKEYYEELVELGERPIQKVSKKYSGILDDNTIKNCETY